MPQQEQQQLQQLPIVKTNREHTFRFRVSDQELEHYKELSLRAGYVTVADACRAGLVLLEQVIVANGK